VSILGATSKVADGEDAGGDDDVPDDVGSAVWPVFLKARYFV
jgi:hypothetical protein